MASAVPRVIFCSDANQSGGRENWFSTRLVNGVWTAPVAFFDRNLTAAINGLWSGKETFNISLGSITEALAGKPGCLFTTNIANDDYRVVFNGDGLPTIDNPPPLGNAAYDLDIAVGGTTQSFGAWWYNNAWWALVSGLDVVPSPDVRYQTFIVKCTAADGNGPWVIQDFAGTPNNATALGMIGLHFRWDGVSSIIRVWGSFDAITWYFWDFDMSTGLWSDSPSTGHASLTLAGAARTGGFGNFYRDGLVQLANGDTVVFYERPSTGTGNSAYYRYYKGGVWQAEQVLAAGVAGETRHYYKVVLDPNGARLHVWYYHTGPSPGFVTTTYYVQLENEVLGTPVVHSTNNADSVIIWPFDASGSIYATYFGGTGETKCLVGTPLSNPVWTETLVATGPNTHTRAIYITYGQAGSWYLSES